MVHFTFGNFEFIGQEIKKADKTPNIEIMLENVLSAHHKK